MNKKTVLKKLVLILSILLMCSTISNASTTGVNLEFKLSDEYKELHNGETNNCDYAVVVNVNFPNNDYSENGVSSAQLAVNYNADKLEFVGISATYDEEGEQVSSVVKNEHEKGKINLVSNYINSLKGYIEQSEICVLYFKMKTEENIDLEKDVNIDFDDGYSRVIDKDSKVILGKPEFEKKYIENDLPNISLIGKKETESDKTKEPSSNNANDVADKVLPQAGSSIFIMCSALIIVGVVGIYTYYKKIKI